MRRWLAALTAIAAGVLMAVGIVQAAPQAKAASLVQVTNFGSNPSNLQMYIYVPNSVQANPPILLALHQCTGSGPGFYSGTSFASLADQYGFIVIYPSVTRSGSCWDVSSSQALTRNGGSDPVGLMSMITYTEQHYGGNPNAVYVTGASSGAMMTNVMLGDYPDVFKAGAAFMGVPFGCFYTGTVDGWNSACANGQVTNTAQAWGNMVRNADPGYSGPRPRMQLWHGTADTTLNYENLSQEILQWTNVLGVSSTPTSTTTPVSGWTETQYDNSSGTPEVEAFSIAGAGHVLPIEGEGMETDAIDFMGLNTTSSGGGGGGGGGAVAEAAGQRCLPRGLQHDQPVDRRVHRQRHDHQHRLFGDIRLDAEVHLPRRPAHHERLERHRQPKRRERDDHQRQLQRRDRARRQHLRRLPGHLDQQRRDAGQLHRQRHDLHLTSRRPADGRRPRRPDRTAGPSGYPGSRPARASSRRCAAISAKS